MDKTNFARYVSPSSVALIPPKRKNKVARNPPSGNDTVFVRHKPDEISQNQTKAQETHTSFKDALFRMTPQIDMSPEMPLASKYRIAPFPPALMLACSLENRLFRQCRSKRLLQFRFVGPFGRDESK